MLNKSGGRTVFGFVAVFLFRYRFYLTFCNTHGILFVRVNVNPYTIFLNKGEKNGFCKKVYCIHQRQACTS